MNTNAIALRDATPPDVETVRRVAAAAWRDTYAGLLKPSTIESFVDAAYSLSALERRIEADTFLIAELDGRLASFADATLDGDRVNLAAIYADPALRGRGTGSLLLAVLRSRFPRLPIVADVLVGNRKGEIFYERRGFQPRERLEGELFGERVVERRWWLDPVEAQGPGDGAEDH